MIKGFGEYLSISFKILPSANRLTQALNQIRSGVPTLELLMNEFSNLKLIKRNSNELDNIEFQNLKIENLNFAYSKNKNILHKVNLEIEKGEIIGIIGNSGSGKSTLIDLITGLLSPSNGSIYINGKKLGENLGSWLKIIGYVPQEIFILDDTLEKNITFGAENKKRSKLQIQEILNLLELDGLVKSLPNGLKTNLNERGTRISGGQKQRIGIARALFNNPDIIILDEATNALDMNTEKVKRLHVAHKFMEYVGECFPVVYSMKGNSIWERCITELQIEHPILRMVTQDQSKERYIMYLEGIPSYFVKTMARPSIEFEEIAINHINTTRYIKGRGTFHIENFLSHLPQINPSNSSFHSNKASGTASVSLRGLGGTRTLILLNGKRLSPGTPMNGTSEQDLSQIPLSLIKKVDILNYLHEHNLNIVNDISNLETKYLIEEILNNI